MHRTWRRDAPLVMLLVLFDLTSQLVIRIFPLVILLEHQPIAGGALAAVAYVWAAIVSLRASYDSEQECCDLLMIILLFSQTNFFFAFT